MLSVYRRKTLKWVQTTIWEDYNFDLMAGQQCLLTYRLAKPFRFETVIESATQRLTIKPHLGGWTISRLAEGEQTVNLRAGHITTPGGTTYTWETLNFWGTRRRFRIKGGEDVLRFDGVTWSLRAHADLHLGQAQISEQDLTLLCGLALHIMVIERYTAALMLVIAALVILQMSS